MATLTSAQKAPLLDELDQQLQVGVHNVVSDDNAVAQATNIGDLWWIVAIAPGSCTINATSPGGATASLPVDVTQATFQIHLGTPVPK